MGGEIIDAEEIDLHAFIRRGDTVAWGQSAAEPVVLTRAFARQGDRFVDVRAFLGTGFADEIGPECADHVEFLLLGATGSNAKLVGRGATDVIPCHLSDLPGLIAGGTIAIDVLLISLAEAGDGYNLGVCVDYMPEALAAARTVVAEVNDRMPETCGDTAVDPALVHARVRTSRPLPQTAPRPPGRVERAIAERVASLIPDRATLQVGIGAIPDAVLGALHGHRDLGVHSGIIGDPVAELMEAGVVTNRYKEIDEGATVAAVLHGTDRIYGYAHRNPRIRMKPYAYTHDAAVLGKFGRLFTIGSAAEVDLTGQVNAESIAGRPVGQVGGQVDFVRAGARSPGGRSIIALPATARGGQASRIVGRLSGPTTTARSDVDVVLTEYGIAELRGVPIRERVRRLVAIAHPAFRSRLEGAAEGVV